MAWGRAAKPAIRDGPLAAFSRAYAGLGVGTVRASLSDERRKRALDRGCDMSRNCTEAELRQFYVRWAVIVNTFCRLYLGDAEAADQVVSRAFLQYFRRELPLRLDRVPTGLMSLTLEESNSAGEVGVTDAESDFEWAVLELPPDERAVFILHGVLDLQLPCVAAVTGIPFAAVSQLWIRALIQLRMSTVHDGCSRLFAGCGSAPQPVPGACA